jgi:molybdenum cofactor synthesis domain-containing protein
VVAICVSERTGIAKHPVGVCQVHAGAGIEGDAHAGTGHRQISALGEEHIAEMRTRVPDLSHGAFGENLVTRGIDWADLDVGRRLWIGPVAAQVTQHGKECHTRCVIYETAGDCIMPRQGVFLRARSSGELQSGAAIATDRDLDRIRCAVLTVSDRSAAGEREDRSGPAVRHLLEERLGAFCVAAEVVADNHLEIADSLTRLADNEVIDLIVTSGGTGLSPRDVTPEATADVIDRKVPGMAEAIRAAGLTHTHHAMLSRAICGQRGDTLILNLSGSPKAAREQVEVVLPALPHAVSVISGVPQSCARGEEKT